MIYQLILSSALNSLYMNDTQMTEKRIIRETNDTCCCDANEC